MATGAMPFLLLARRRWQNFPLGEGGLPEN